MPSNEGNVVTAEGGMLALEGWRFVCRMLDDMTAVIEADAETEQELLEGLRVLGRVTALCSELSLDVDVDAPWFFSMNTEARLIGGPNPDGEYSLAMIDGGHRYRVRGNRGYHGLSRLPGAGGHRPDAVREYIADRSREASAELAITPLDAPRSRPRRPMRHSRSS